MRSDMIGKRVLLIENDTKCAKQIHAILYKNGIEPHIASTVRNAITWMMINTFDVVALDEGLEGAACLIGLLTDLRQAKNTLLLLFPIEQLEARVSFLNCGFDMCLSMADPRECAAAICALLRRPSVHEYPTEATPPGRIIYKDLTLDPLRQKVWMKGIAVTLTTMEFRLLYFLASNPAIIFSKERIYERVWQENSLYGSKSVSDMICSIRRKLKLSPKDTTYIKTVKCAGYCFAP